MNDINIFYEVLQNTCTLALATSAGDTPNVRILNYCYDRGRPGVLYFASDRDNQKIEEIRQNPLAALTTIPPGEEIAHIRAKGAFVKKSTRPMDVLKELFISHVPGYKETLDAIGHTLDVYEIHVREAVVILGFDEILPVQFKSEIKPG